jgi:hypothetical protein
MTHFENNNQASKFSNKFVLILSLCASIIGGVTIAAFHFWLRNETWGSAVVYGLQMSLVYMIVMGAVSTHSIHVEKILANSEQQVRWNALYSELREKRRAAAGSGGKPGIA